MYINRHIYVYIHIKFTIGCKQLDRELPLVRDSTNKNNVEYLNSKLEEALNGILAKVYINTCIFICICIYMCIYMYVCKYMYIHRYLLIYLNDFRRLYIFTYIYRYLLVYLNGQKRLKVMLI
jgi:hypothetical protein